MNRENYSSVTGAAVGVSGVRPIVSAENSIAPGSDEAFQKLLLRISAQGSGRSDSNALIQFFCRTTREFFQVSGVYFWRCQTGDELVGEQSDGKLTERFKGIRLRSDQSTVTADAVRQRRAIFANQVRSKAFPAAMEFDARSLLAAPLIVFKEVIGAVTFLHDAEDDFFNEDLATKATILAGQLGTLLEAARLGDASREEHRRAEILADVAHVLHGTPDVSSVIEALADRLRLLLRTPLVCVLLKREGPFELKAVSADTPQLAISARARHDRQTLRFAADLAQRAVSAGEPITLSIGADVHSLGSLVSPGMLIAAPFRASRTQGAILIYPRQEGVFTLEERALVAAVTGFGAVAIAHAELHATSHAQARELHQLLEISSELSSSEDLEHFLQAFVTRAADFLGFGRCFIALLENDEFWVRYGVERGESKRVENVFPEGIATRALRAKEVFWTDEATRLPGANLDAVTKYKVQQFLAVPLLGTRGKLLGMFGVLDRMDGTGISQEDIRRARALSNHAALMLEVASNLHMSEQHRRRAEALIELAQEIDGALRLPEFGRRFVSRIAELTGSRNALLAILQSGNWHIAAQHRRSSGVKPSESPTVPGTHANELSEHQPFELRKSDDSHSEPSLDRDADRMLGVGLTEFLQQHPEAVVRAPAEQVFGGCSAGASWTDCTLVRLRGPNGQLDGVLCLDRDSAALNHEDRVFLETMAGHAATALENARLFTKVEQANRHWVEIFDAITDFIVVHDQADRVLRVNRSLAEMIGVPPAELIGVNMRALMALTNESASYSCPFCRSMGGRHRRILASRVRPDLPGFHLPGAGRVGRGAPDDPCIEGHLGPSRSRAPLSRTLRQHPGRPVLQHARRALH